MNETSPYHHEGPFPPSDTKTLIGEKKIEFNMLMAESAKMFARMVSALHDQGVVFTVEQDYNLIWICL